LDWINRLLDAAAPNDSTPILQSSPNASSPAFTDEPGAIVDDAAASAEMRASGAHVVWLRARPETLRGRIGGEGAPFNLGEATVSRAAVRLSTGEVGFGYTLGRDREKARMIALCDALIQSNEFSETVEAGVVAPLRAAMMARRSHRAAETAATRVDFYTLVRGEG